jgi:hypothetical protein
MLIMTLPKIGVQELEILEEGAERKRDKYTA